MKTEMLLTKNLVTQLRAIVKHSIKIDEQAHEMDFKSLWLQMKEVFVNKKVKDSDARQRKDLRWVVNAETEAEKTIIMLFHSEAKTSAAEFVKNYFVGLLSNVSQIVQANRIDSSIINEDPVDEKELITMEIMKDIEKYNSWFLFKNQVWKKI